nr:taste receptor type 2 member 19-like [Cavia porcellus]
MASVLQSILTIIVTVVFIVGNFANVFISLVNCSDWVTRQRIYTVDGILSALAVSRIVLLWIMFIGWFSTLFNPVINIGITSHVLWTTVNHFSTWIATSLSIFYLFKIASFSSHILLQLKKRFKGVFVSTILVCLILLLYTLVVISINERTRMKEHEGNVTWKTELGTTVFLSFLRGVTLVHLIPFVTSIVCCLLLTYSLHRHLSQMRQHSKGSQDPSTEVHVKALKTVVSYLLLFAMYSVSIIISGWSLGWFWNETVYLLFQTLAIMYPSSHSCVLICGNRKLKGAFMLGVWQARYLLNKKKPSNPYQ